MLGVLKHTGETIPLLKSVKHNGKEYYQTATGVIAKSKIKRIIPDRNNIFHPKMRAAVVGEPRKRGISKKQR